MVCKLYLEYDMTGYNSYVKYVFLLTKIVFVLANSVDPDEMPICVFPVLYSDKHL